MSGGDFDAVGRGAHGHDCDASAENETTNGELRNGARGASDDGANNDNAASCEHGNSASEAIGNGGGDGSSNDGAPEILVSIALHVAWPERRISAAAKNIHAVERGDDGNLLAGQSSVERVLEGLHGDDGTHQGAIITVGTGAAEGNEDGEVELEGVLAPSLNFGLLNGGEELGLWVHVGLATAI